MYFLYLGIKFLISLVILYNLPCLWALSIIAVLYYIYHYLVMPLIFGLHPLTLEDTFMLFENETNRANFGGVGIYDKVDFETLNDLRKRLIIKFPRLRQTLVNFLGCYYFKELSLEDASKAIVKVEGIHTKDQLERFCEKVCQDPIPKNAPLYKVYIMEDYNDQETAGVLLCHHSIFDGLSNLYLTWMYTEAPGDISLLPNIKEFTLLVKIIMHLTLIISFPIAIFNNLFKGKDRNPINNGRPLTGIKKYSYFDDCPFQKIRENYKKIGSKITMNDYFMAVLSKSLNDYFKLVDPSSKYETINIAIPINLRNKYPKSFDEVVLENNFTAVNIELPLISDINSEAEKIVKILNKMKKSAEFLANSYILKIGVLFSPKQVMRLFNNFITSKTSVCFSNVPYFKKPLVIEGTKCALKATAGFFQNNGEIGVGINIMTYCDRVMVGVMSDTARMEKPEEFARIFKQNLMNI